MKIDEDRWKQMKTDEHRWRSMKIDEDRCPEDRWEPLRTNNRPSEKTQPLTTKNPRLPDLPQLRSPTQEIARRTIDDRTLKSNQKQTAANYKDLQRIHDWPSSDNCRHQRKKSQDLSSADDRNQTKNKQPLTTKNPRLSGIRQLPSVTQGLASTTATARKQPICS